MTDYRKHIEQLKQAFAASLDKNRLPFRRAIIRELDFLYRSLDSARDEKWTEDLIDTVMKRLSIPALHKNSIQQELAETQRKIADVWNEYYEGLMDDGKWKTEKNDYEKILAAYQVDFPGLDKELRDVVVKEIRRGARANYGYEALRSRLLKKDLASYSAATLANTSMAGFDNAYHIEMAQQAGIEEFEYDGVLSPNSRPFCVEHIHKIYTIDELKEMSNGQNLPVEIYLGGYRCSHFLTAVIKRK